MFRPLSTKSLLRLWGWPVRSTAPLFGSDELGRGEGSACRCDFARQLALALSSLPSSESASFLFAALMHPAPHPLHITPPIHQLACMRSSRLCHCGLYNAPSRFQLVTALTIIIYTLLRSYCVSRLTFPSPHPRAPEYHMRVAETTKLLGAGSVWTELAHRRVSFFSSSRFLTASSRRLRRARSRSASPIHAPLAQTPLLFARLRPRRAQLEKCRPPLLWTSPRSPLRSCRRFQWL